jgi:hypothetical protein
MKNQDFTAIYLDRASPAVLSELALEQRGKALTQVYASEGGEARILLLIPVD